MTFGAINAKKREQGIGSCQISLTLQVCTVAFLDWTHLESNSELVAADR